MNGAAAYGRSDWHAIANCRVGVTHGRRGDGTGELLTLRGGIAPAVGRASGGCEELPGGVPDIPDLECGHVTIPHVTLAIPQVTRDSDLFLFRLIADEGM